MLAILAPVLNNQVMIKKTNIIIAGINWGNMYFIIQLTICSINEIYVATAQVKCSLTESDGDSNRVPIQLEGYF
jgi:hypothetical protein